MCLLSNIYFYAIELENVSSVLAEPIWSIMDQKITFQWSTEKQIMKLFLFYILLVESKRASRDRGGDKYWKFNRVRNRGLRKASKELNEKCDDYSMGIS